MADIIPMIKISINKDKIKFNNLHKSLFSELENTACVIEEDRVTIYESSNQNPDPASVELRIKENLYLIYYWDGYSLADKFTSNNYEEALLQFKKFSKKLAKNLKKY